MTDTPPNQTIADRYEVLRPLGRGSFGHTFLAHDREERRDVAIKMLDAQRAPDWKAFELFEREVAVLRGLRHQGVPEVFDSFQAQWGDGDAAFLVMEYVEGTSLEEVIETGSTSEAQEVTRLLLDLLGILEYLHARMPPILHRDIKPANIVIRPSGVPVLVDFGAVRNVFAGPDDGGSTVIGTAGYMPYEQYMGQATPSSDLYALAATFLHVITGRPPRDFMTDGGRIELPETLPVSPLKAVLRRMLEPSPSDRFGSARDARTALLMYDTPTALVARGVPVPGGRSHADVPLAHMIAPVPDFGPAPRALAGDVRDAYDRTKLSVWRLVNTSNKSERPGVGTALYLAVVSAASFGILPAIALGIAVQHRMRLRRFFKEGTPTLATILDIQIEEAHLEQKMARVSYEFEADGLLHRDSDLVLPTTGVRLRPGERVHVLYIAERDHDSVIVRV
jgi:serine/threonine protein kinase